jgi:hypothetical protein
MGYLDDFMWITIDEHPKNDKVLYANIYSDKDSLTFDDKAQQENLNKFLSSLSKLGKNVAVNLYDYDDAVDVQKSLKDLDRSDIKISIE